MIIELICGKRRISHKCNLVRKEIEVKLVSATDLREAEADENNETKEVNKGYNQVRRFQRIKEAY